MASKKRSWTWKEEQPGAVILVALIIAIALLFPHESCRPNSDVEPHVTVSPDGDAPTH